VPAGKLTELTGYPKAVLPLEKYISNAKEFKKEKFQMVEDRYNYTSPDEATIYQTIVRNDSSEFVYSISIKPGKDKQQLLCKSGK